MITLNLTPLLLFTPLPLYFSVGDIDNSTDIYRFFILFKRLLFTIFYQAIDVCFETRPLINIHYFLQPILSSSP